MTYYLWIEYDKYMNNEHKVNNWIDYFEKTTVLSNYFNYRRTLLNKLMRYSNEGDIILELGTGTGWSSISLSLANRYVVALDISEKILRGVNRLAQNLQTPIDTICADMKMLPFRDNSFKIAFSQGVLEHFDDNAIILMVKEQAKVAPIIIVDVPTNKAKNQPRAYGDERWLSWKYWKKLLENAGTKVSLIYGSSPSPFSYLLPLGIQKLIGYRFSMAIGLICIRKNYRFNYGRLRERLID